MKLECNYRELKARITAEKSLERQASLASAYPYAELVRYGLVKDVGESRARVGELLSFFGLVDLTKVPIFAPAAFRRTRSRRASPEACAAWLRIGELLAQRIHLSGYDRASFQEALESFRSYTRNSPEQYEADLVATCAKSGVALVFFPHLEHTYANGAAKWMDARHAMLQLSLRYRWADVFWFSLFHEAAHILLHGRKCSFLDQDGRESDAREREADDFAANLLIPPTQYRALVARRNYTEETITRFASQIGVGANIVVGRLAHDREIAPGHLRHLRPQLSWAKDPREWFKVRESREAAQA